MTLTVFNQIKVKKKILYTVLLGIGAQFAVYGQTTNSIAGQVNKKGDPIIKQIIDEAQTNSQLEQLAFELLEFVGPRLVGTPGMTKANDWALSKFESWGIPAQKQQFGEWRGWERGISHIDMVYPRIKTLAGTQLAWSPSTKGKTIVGEVIPLGNFKDSIEFQAWLPSVKGKYVMIAMPQPTGRPDRNWEEYGKTESIEKMNKERDAKSAAWNKRIRATGMSANSIPSVLEEAGAVGILTSNWSKELVQIRSLVLARTSSLLWISLWRIMASYIVWPNMV